MVLLLRVNIYAVPVDAGEHFEIHVQEEKQETLLASSLVATAVVCDDKGQEVMAQHGLKDRKLHPVVAKETRFHQ